MGTLLGRAEIYYAAMQGQYPAREEHCANHYWHGVRAGCFHGSIDIYSIHDEMRDQAPVWRSPWGDVFVTRYDLVSACLVNRQLSHVPPNDRNHASDQRSAINEWLMYQEGHAHAAIRQALQQPFVGKGATALEPFVAEAVDLLVSKADLAGVVDVVAAFTRAVPERVIGRLLGVPVEDMPRLRAWSASIRVILDSGFDDAFGPVSNAAEEMSAYFTDLLRDLLARGEMPPLLVGLPPLVDKLGLETAGRNIAFLAFAGHETTVHLIGNMLFHLAHAPSQWASLLADRRLAASAVAETLRLESPVQKICRWPVKPTELAGQPIDEDQLIVLLIGAANRDPEQFPQPQVFDITRHGRQNLAFGRGAHVCIGRTLAEMEGRLLLEAVLRRWRSLEPTIDGAKWTDNSSIRGLERLSLRLS
ncbi:cytochrome P450 [Mesorhizobium sp. LCM 4577]|uniref:cytochrome P450 n=1 Tax=Mesorhizobium sp. LCM 4577 TaxID=1848288 RepID=UPI000B1A500A|nr:cytochrome P450 [Mesorhizobium sp. LCM 4577]